MKRQSTLSCARTETLTNADNQSPRRPFHSGQSGVLSLRATLFVLTVSAFLCAVEARAVFIEEHFNNYGTNTRALSGRGAAGAGWAGGWSGDLAVDYKPLINLTYLVPGYSNSGQEADLNDGTAGHGGGRAINRVMRTIDADPVAPGNQGLTGTIWISALMYYDVPGPAPLADDILFWLDLPDGANNWVGLAGSSGTTYPGPSPDGICEPWMQYAGVDDSLSELDFINDKVYLLLVKIVMNVGGDTNDLVQAWFSPPLAGGEAGLPTPVFSKGSADAFGAAFTGIGISFQSGGERIDAIRISDDPDGYLKVTYRDGPPTVAATLSGSSLTFSYPAAAAAFRLEASETLAPGSFEPVVATPVPSGDDLTVTVETTGVEAKFYRLAYP